MQEIILIENLVEGMVLDEPIISNFGQVLLGKGTVLTPKIINNLKSWNIPLAVIFSKENECEEIVFNDEIISLAKKQLTERMKWIPRNGFEEEIIQMGIFHKYKTILRK